jgi:hypothetical protein
MSALAGCLAAKACPGGEDGPGQGRRDVRGWGAVCCCSSPGFTSRWRHGWALSATIDVKDHYMQDNVQKFW